MEQQAISKVCLLAGKIMLESGAETYRVEDTMVRIAQAFGMDNAQSHATPSAITFAIDMTEQVHFVRIDERVTDLYKVSRVNSISRHISENKLTVADAREELLKVDDQKYLFSQWMRIFAAAFASGCFTIMFQGSWYDFLPAFVVGGLGYSTLQYFNQLLKIRFFAEFLASFLLAFSAFVLIEINIGVAFDSIIIGSIMPLVPGLLITNAVRDMMAGHLVSGITKAVEAILTALAIGAGVAIVILIFY